jgi:ribosome biogenesis GTPase
MAFGVPVHVVSATDSTGLVNLEAFLSQGRTIAMIGSSGAGKSTLVNRLYGKPIQVTQDISERIGKGRHTTTGRSLIQMPQGGMVIDNPGIREIGLWDDGNGLDAAFPEIDALAAACRFHDCTHTHEPDCQVLQGIASGSIRQDRLDSYRKLKRELAYVAIRQEKSASRVEKERWKKIRMKIKQIKK